MVNSVCLCTNGMVMVFDSRGEQVPEFQGRLREVLGRLLALPEAPSIAWHWLQFGEWQEQVSFAQVECFWKQSFAAEREREEETT